MVTHDLSHQQFTAKEIEQLLGVDKNKLFHWINTHSLLKPDINEGRGRGSRRIFSRNNMLELALIKKLTAFGIDLAMIKNVKDCIESRKVFDDSKQEDFKRRGIHDYYDLAFEGDFAIGLKISKTEEEFIVEILHWEAGPWKKEDEDLIKYPGAFLMINISTMAKEIQEKIKR